MGDCGSGGGGGGADVRGEMGGTRKDGHELLNQRLLKTIKSSNK